MEPLTIGLIVGLASLLVGALTLWGRTTQRLERRAYDIVNAEAKVQAEINRNMREDIDETQEMVKSLARSVEGLPKAMQEAVKTGVALAIIEVDSRNKI